MTEDDDSTELAPVEVSAELQELLDRYPLPADIKDVNLNKDGVARALNTTLPTLNRWMEKPGFPMIQPGGAGRNYVFRLSHVYAWWRNDQEQQELRSKQVQASIEKMHALQLGLELDDPQAKLTAKQRKELAEADYQWSRATMMRRQLVRLDDVQVLLDDLMRSFRESAEALTDRLERELHLTPKQLEAVSRASRDALEALAERIEREQLDGAEIEAVEPENRLLI